MHFEGRIVFVLGAYLLCTIQRCYASEYVTRTVVVGHELHLVCPLQNSSGNVTWYLGDTKIVKCNENVARCDTLTPLALSFASSVTRNETMSVLTYKVRDNSFSGYMSKCKVNDQIKRFFLLVIIRPEDVGQPLCTVSPSLGPDVTDVTKINAFCELNATHLIDQRLEIRVNNETVTFDTSRNVSHTFDYDENDTSLISCQTAVIGSDNATIRNCHFPRRVEITFRRNNPDIEFECIIDEQVSDLQIIWRLLEIDEEVNITNRSWIREEGRSMLLREITEQDIGRVIECSGRQKSSTENIHSIGFQIVHRFDPDEKTSTTNNSKINIETQHDPYKILFSVFFIMWVLTVAMISAWYMYPKTKSQCHPSRVSFIRRGKQRSEGEGKENAQGMSERKADADNGDGRPNQNNSSSNDISKRGQGDSGSIPDQPSAEKLQQGDGNTCADNPVYFCVDRSPATIRSSWKSSQANQPNEIHEDLDPNDYDYVGTRYTNDMVEAMDGSMYAEVGSSLADTAKTLALYGKVKK